MPGSGACAAVNLRAAGRRARPPCGARRSRRGPRRGRAAPRGRTPVPACATRVASSSNSLRRQLDQAALHPDLEAVAVDLEVAGLERLAARPGPSAVRAAVDRPHAGHQLARREGLGDVVVGAHLEAEHLVAFLDAPGHHDHGDGDGLRVLLEPAADLPAVELRHHDVEQDHVRAARPAPGGGHPSPLAASTDVVAFLAEVVADQLGHVRSSSTTSTRGPRGTVGFSGPPRRLPLTIGSTPTLVRVMGGVCAGGVTR